eukprot:7387335-Prymnesium_polylepis.2
MSAGCSTACEALAVCRSLARTDARDDGLCRGGQGAGLRPSSRWRREDVQRRGDGPVRDVG